MTKRLPYLLLLLWLGVAQGLAQKVLQQANYGEGNVRSNSGADDSFDDSASTNRLTWGRDTTRHKAKKEIPMGLFQWKIDPVLGNVIPAENNDTVPHLYSHFNATDGYNGEYSYLGNLASPRLSRVYLNRTNEHPFLFLAPLDYAQTNLGNLLFSNTKSPITNLSYHSCGTRENGEDRVRAYFASNINKVSGIGFKIDYLYGRGYYSGSQSSSFLTDFFAYHRGERYNFHLWVDANHQKIAENGGIEDDRYIHDPQSFPQKYKSTEIPVMLQGVFNRNDNQSIHFNHRYNLGYDREIYVPDSLKPKMPTDVVLLRQLNDSLRNVLATDTLQCAQVLDSLRTRWQQSILTPTEFIPVASLVHTLHIERLKHFHYEGQETPADYYTDNFYGTQDKLKDKTIGLRVRNTLALSMLEGFKKWVKMGISVYAAHELERYGMPLLGYEGGQLQEGIRYGQNGLPAIPDSIGNTRYIYNNVLVGGQLLKSNGRLLHYDAKGEFTVLGHRVGDFLVTGKGDLNLELGRRDTLSLRVNAKIQSLSPEGYLEHYHSRHAWWDNTGFKKELRTRIEGTLQNQRSRTSLRAGVENITNYTYLVMRKTLLAGKDAASVNNTDYSHRVDVRQQSGSVQVIGATLCQDVTLGPVNWENEVTYQISTNQDVLPLPKVNVYSNLYLLFRIARVLRVELGGDIRYFTRYYAPDYSPAVGQFAVQDNSHPRIKCGNYPIINAYCNLHLKHARIYVKAGHVNQGTGNMFLAPHYPLNPWNIHWGVSWNFFN